MAELVGKTVTELPSATALGDSDAFAISQSGTSRKTFWSLIKSYFPVKGVRANNVIISENQAAIPSQPITIFQTSAASGAQIGLIVAKTYVGLYDADNAVWLWRTPIMDGGAQNSWGVSQGGTGATTAAGARSALELSIVRSGYVTAGIATDSVVTTHIDFPEPFPNTTGQVVACLGGSYSSSAQPFMASLSVSVTNITASGFDLLVGYTGTTSLTTAGIRWIAVGN